MSAANAEDAPDQEEERRRRNSRKTGKFRKLCLTDPDASLATRGPDRRVEPSCEQHGVVDDVFGVVLDVEVATGETNEGEQLLAARRGRPDDRDYDPDRDRRCGRRLRQDLRRSGAARYQWGDPDQGRCEARHPEVPTRGRSSGHMAR